MKDKETRAQAFELFEMGYKSRKVSTLLGIDRSTAKEWQYLYEGGDLSWLSENAVDRACNICMEKRVLIVELIKCGKLTIAQASREYKVTRSTLKNWIRMQKKEK
jgi:transposase-like protein